ncbi:MAG: hypothetical protein U1G07_16465 [Verrucomicrobiota bacterium]
MSTDIGATTDLNGNWTATITRFPGNASYVSYSKDAYAFIEGSSFLVTATTRSVERVDVAVSTRPRDWADHGGSAGQGSAGVPVRLRTRSSSSSSPLLMLHHHQTLNTDQAATSAPGQYRRLFRRCLHLLTFHSGPRPTNRFDWHSDEAMMGLAFCRRTPARGQRWIVSAPFSTSRGFLTGAGGPA